MKLIFKLFFVFLYLTSCSKEVMKTQNNSSSECVDTISFNNEIMEIINNSCFSCHGDGSTLPKISNYTDVTNNADAIYNSFTGNGIKKMPPEPNTPVADTLLQKFSCWIKQGKQNN